MRHSNRKEIGSCEASAVDPRHCQETLTELPVSGLSLRCLGWTADGELTAADQFELLQELMTSSQVDVQIEMIHLIEATVLRQPCASLDITPTPSF